MEEVTLTKIELDRIITNAYSLGVGTGIAKNQGVFKGSPKERLKGFKKHIKQLQ